MCYQRFPSFSHSLEEVKTTAGPYQSNRERQEFLWETLIMRSVFPIIEGERSVVATSFDSVVPFGDVVLGCCCLLTLNILLEEIGWKVVRGVVGCVASVEEVTVSLLVLFSFSMRSFVKSISSCGADVFLVE